MSTGGAGRNRRRRGRRGQRARQENQTQDQQAQQAPQEAAPRNEQRRDPRPPESQQARASHHDTDQQGDRKSGARKHGRNRRGRTTKRPALDAMPTQVLKERVRDLPAVGKMAMRTVDEVATADGLVFGCPMLTRTRMGMPFADGRRMPRCSMGWAVHDEEEASLCMRTPDLLDCWKEHPEREAELRGTSERENAAD